MRAPIVNPIVIAAGGTGGHFFPAEALASELLARGQRVALMTDSRTAQENFAVFSHAERFIIKGAGIAGRGPVQAAKAAAALVAGTLQARRILALINASAVIGFGGYPSVAPVLATRLLRRRAVVVLHEQNAVLGRANRFLARHADILALNFPDTARLPPGVRAEVTGLPVRAAIGALATRAYTPPGESFALLVLGGSLGARVFSDIVPPALAALPPALRARLHVTQQCRAEDLERVRAAYDASGIVADLAPFFTDIAERLGAAHFVIARAGASSVAELASAGRPSILVPLPNAIDDHQAANARTLEALGGAWVMAQSQFTAEALCARLEKLITDPASLILAARAARGGAHENAAARLADTVEKLIPDARPQDVRPQDARRR
ncbi:MAG: undecaprenyldiphospho-muramoylpentapeptide beta-N-acetylglucosaminyltransferase [Acetobacteraceae bacterium]|nr:undecaprenyldiphospho-muramoylpentapeptide beta-N-acetylglucosaminyltransferase [Acetobacteraceae bacterium]